MLTEAQKKEIDEETAHYPQRRGACVSALKIVQRDKGWISDESLKDIADYLEMTPDELDGVATFFNLIFRRPVGKHVLLLCDSVSCWIMGYPEIRERLKQRLGVDFGGTTADGQFTLLPIVCLGDCDHAPALMVDEDLHHDLKPDQVDEILGRYSE